MCDFNDDGFITKKELVKYLIFMGFDEDDEWRKELVDTLMRMADDDEDGKLNYDEFCKMADDCMADYFGF